MSDKPTRYLRFDGWERLEHTVLIISFTVLSVTGLPQKWPDSYWGNLLIQLMGGIEWTRMIHHAAAVILILSTLYHVLAVTYRILVLRRPMTLLPRWRDAKDAAQALFYNLGRVTDPPRMGRYTFGEKFEYCALESHRDCPLLPGAVHSCGQGCPWRRGAAGRAGHHHVAHV